MSDQIEVNLGDVPNDLYRKFFEKFKEIEQMPVESWNKGTHILSYFCSKYRQHYKIDYKFKFNTSAPSKCFEVFQVSRLSMMLSSNPKVLKEYIDWIFSDKIPQTKRRITSISFLTREETVNDYKINYLLKDRKSLEITRTSVLPDEYAQYFVNTSFSPKTYGDLSFMLQMKDMPEQLSQAFNMLERAGLDVNTLRKII